MSWFDNFRKILLVNPMSTFVMAIVSKWYILLICASLVVVFWTFRGLQQAGVLSKVQSIVGQALSDTKAVAKYCIPLIADPRQFFYCVQNTKEYQATEESEKTLDKTEKEFDNFFENHIMPDAAHPDVDAK